MKKERMKNFKWTMGILVIGIAFFTSCDKNQQVVKTLDGEWKATSWKEDGFEWVVNDSTDITYTFNDCKVKNEDCSGTYAFSYPGFGSLSIPFTYNIQSEGTRLNVDFSSPDVTDWNNFVITKQTDTQFEFNGIDSDAYHYDIKLEKQ